MTDHEQPAAGVALKLLIKRLESWPISYATGCCMCGSPMEGHSLYDNHSPTDEGEYKIGEALREAKEALKAPTDAGGAVSEANERNLSASNAELLEQALSHPPLTPAPQAEGEASDAWEDRCRDCDDTGVTIQTERRCSCDAGMALSAPQPLQQGGEVTREQVARIIDPAAFMFTADDLGLKTPTPEHQSDALDKARRILALFATLAADRDKAVGLLREWLASRTYGQRVALHAESDAFLSSQTEGR